MEILPLKSIPLFYKQLKSLSNSLGSTTTPFPINKLVLLLYYRPTGRKFSTSPFGNLSIRNKYKYDFQQMFDYLAHLALLH